MTAEEHLDAISKANAAGFSDDILAMVLKSINDQFGADGDVTDDEAVGAMDPDTAAAYRATDATPETKAALLSTGKYQATQRKIAVALATAKTTPAKTEAKAFSVADIGKIVAEAVTKAMPGQGRQVEVKGNPVAGVSTDKTGFSAKMLAIEKAEGCNRPTALLKARKEDPKAFNAWVAAGRPQ